MIYSNHEFDKDKSYHDFLVNIHTKDLTSEFANMAKYFTGEKERDEADALASQPQEMESAEQNG